MRSDSCTTAPKQECPRSGVHPGGAGYPGLRRVIESRPVQRICRFDCFQFDDLCRLGCRGSASTRAAMATSSLTWVEDHVSLLSESSTACPATLRGWRQTNFEIAA